MYRPTTLLGYKIITLKQFISHIPTSLIQDDKLEVCWAILRKSDPSLDGTLSYPNFTDQCTDLLAKVTTVPNAEVLKMGLTKRLLSGLFHKNLLKALKTSTLNAIKSKGLLPTPFSIEAAYELVMRLRASGADYSSVFWVRIAPRSYALCDSSMFRAAHTEEHLYENSRTYDMFIKHYTAVIRIDDGLMPVVEVQRPRSPDLLRLLKA